MRRIWIGAVLDVFSRKVVAIRAFARVPKARDVRRMLRGAFVEFGTPSYLVTDRGCQFKADALSKFLKRRGVLRRYGAVARWQSVAVIDRFFKSFKGEYASRWFVLQPLARINDALHRYVRWFSIHRPHQGIGGRAPDEVYFRRSRRHRVAAIRDVRLTHFRDDPKLPVYRRVLAA